MAYTLVPTELIQDGAVTSAKLDTNIAISGTLSVAGVTTLATHLVMGDNDKIKIGTGGDLEIYHDASNSYIANSTGNLYIGDTNGSVHIQAKLNEDSIVAAADGAVTLYYDNAPKLATSSAGVTVTGNATFADSDKAIFGAGSDLQIYHDGSHSHIINATGDLTIDSQGDDLILKASDDFLVVVQETDIAIQAVGDGKVGLRYNNFERLATTNTGIDVTGTATMDGLTVDGTGTITFNDVGENIFSPSAGILAIESRGQVQIWGDTNNNGASTSAVFEILRDSTYAGGTGKQTLTAYDNGDISFYEDTGSTAKLFWDASAESLGIGTSSPNSTVGKVDIAGATTNYNTAPMITFEDTAGSTNSRNWSIGNIAINYGDFHIGCGDTNSDYFDGTSHSKFMINKDGNVGIGTTSPSGYYSGADNLVVYQATGEVGMTIATGNSSVGALYFADGTTGTDAYKGGIAYAHSTDVLTLVSGGAAKINIDATGNTYPNVNGSWDLGKTTNRYKDLYLSGGAYIGGTGAANKLDDYEEGAWTPAWSATTSTVAVQSATYTKIGNLVTVHAFITNISPATSADQQTLTGLPFVATPNSTYGTGNIVYSGDAVTEGIGMLVATGSQYFYFHYLDGTSSNSLTRGNWNSIKSSGLALLFSATYRTDQ